MAVTPCPSLHQLSAHVDGELSAVAREALELHHAGCARCAARLADLRTVGALLRLHVEGQVDRADLSDFADRVLARLQPHRPSLGERLRVGWEEWWTYRPATVMGGVGLAAAALLAFLLVPDALRQGIPGDTRSNPSFQAVSTDEQSHVAPVVLKTEGGDAIIWLVDHPDRPALSLGSDASVPEVAPAPPPRPKGGEL
jgi:anti-sigma factor RsiW